MTNKFPKTNSYTSQLKGWAVDRAINIYKDKTIDADAIIGEAQKLVEYCFNPVEEIETLQRELDQKREQYEAEQEYKVAMELAPASNKSEAA